MSIPLHPAFYVVVELASASNMYVLNSKRMSKLRVAALHRAEAAARSKDALAAAYQAEVDDDDTEIEAELWRPSTDSDAVGDGVARTEEGAGVFAPPSETAARAAAAPGAGDGAAALAVAGSSSAAAAAATAPAGTTAGQDASASRPTDADDRLQAAREAAVVATNSGRGSSTIGGFAHRTLRSIASLFSLTSSLPPPSTRSSSASPTATQASRSGRPRRGARDSGQGLAASTLQVEPKRRLVSHPGARGAHAAVAHDSAGTAFDATSGAGSDFHLGPFMLPIFGAGYTLASDALHTVLVQSFFDPEVVHFAEELLTPSPEQASRLLLEPVPRRFHGKTWGVLFLDLLDNYDAVALGLYRCRRPCDAPLPYVVTNPDVDAKLYSAEDDEDMIYVLAKRPLFSGPYAAAPDMLVGTEPHGSTHPDPFAAQMTMRVSRLNASRARATAMPARFMSAHADAVGAASAVPGSGPARLQPAGAIGSARTHSPGTLLHVMTAPLPAPVMKFLHSFCASVLRALAPALLSKYCALSL